jgi:hypothetical protein
MVAGRGRGRVAVLVSAVTLSTSFAVVSSVGVVSAEGSVDTVVTETGDALEVAGDLVADAAPVVESADGFVAVVAGSVVEIPADPVEPLTLGGVGGEVEVELPVVAGVADGVVDESGAVVFESEVSPVSLAAQATDDGGLQVLVVIDDAAAPTEYRFDMTVPDGAVLRSTGDGGAEVVGSDGALVSAVAPPWAVDATGVSVSTSYRIEGSTLVQVVAHHGTAYPVVADPRIFWIELGLFAIEFNRSETQRIIENPEDLYLFCSSLSLIKSVGKYIALLCEGHTWWTVKVAKWAYAGGGCLVVEVGINPRSAGSGVTWTPTQRVCGSTSHGAVSALTALVSSVRARIVARVETSVAQARRINVCRALICDLFPLFPRP